MLTLHWNAYGDVETHSLPITISESEIEVLISDCCEPIVQPPITSNDLNVLRRSLIEWHWDQGRIEAIEGEVLV